jgi:hypothetical protein
LLNVRISRKIQPLELLHVQINSVMFWIVCACSLIDECGWFLPKKLQASYNRIFSYPMRMKFTA